MWGVVCVDVDRCELGSSVEKWGVGVVIKDWRGLEVGSMMCCTILCIGFTCALVVTTTLWTCGTSEGKGGYTPSLHTPTWYHISSSRVRKWSCVK